MPACERSANAGHKQAMVYGVWAKHASLVAAFEAPQAALNLLLEFSRADSNVSRIY
jgi:hypothetical protein